MSLPQYTPEISLYEYPDVMRLRKEIVNNMSNTNMQFTLAKGNVELDTKKIEMLEERTRHLLKTLHYHPELDSETRKKLETAYKMRKSDEERYQAAVAKEDAAMNIERTSKEQTIHNTVAKIKLGQLQNLPLTRKMAAVDPVPTSENYTPLMKAVQIGDVGKVKQLLEEGADPNVRHMATGRTALMQAGILASATQNDTMNELDMSMIYETFPKMRSLLINAGASTSMIDYEGRPYIEPMTMRELDTCKISGGKKRKRSTRKTKSKKGGKSKKSRKTRSSKKRGGVGPNKPTTQAFISGLMQASEARANPVVVNAAFDGFITNEVVIKRIYREGGFVQATMSILGRFRRLLRIPIIMQMIRDRIEELNMEGSDESWRAIYNNLQETDQELAELYNNFIQELFSLTFSAAESP